MTLRQQLGEDAQRLHVLLDRLLDSEDAIVVLTDGRQWVNYGRGFGLSPCHHELVATEIERAIRAVTRAHPPREERRQEPLCRT